MDEKPSANPAGPQVAFAEPSAEDAFVKSHFRKFYESHRVNVPSVTMREFGFGWEKKIDLRHKAFLNQKELQEYFVGKVPLYASYSAAFYEYPGARPMSAKNFLRAELIFDLDADQSHEGHNPVLCGRCLATVKSDIIRLVEDFLVPDFGFSPSELSVNFSGSKGYHVHAYAESLLQLSAQQRAQLVEYVGGTNVDFQRFFFANHHVLNGRAVETICGPDEHSSGWGRRILSRAKATLALSDDELASALKAAGYTKKQADSIVANKPFILDSVSRGKWSALEKPMLLVAEIARQAGIGSRVQLDRGVTIDMARLIRIPDTLHGDTGFLAKTLSIKELGAFDPTLHATAFGSSPVERIFALDDYEFDFAGTRYSLKKERMVSLPLDVAVLLLCKGKAKFL